MSSFREGRQRCLYVNFVKEAIALHSVGNTKEHKRVKTRLFSIYLDCLSGLLVGAPSLQLLAHNLIRVVLHPYQIQIKTFFLKRNMDF